MERKQNATIEKEQRNSSFELLRIIGMVLIVANHYSTHGGFSINTADDVTFGVVFVQWLNMFGKISCSVFALISGYFLVTRTFDRHYRKIIPLIVQILFYSWGIYITFRLFLPGHIAGVDTARSFHPITRIGNWYVTYYVLFYLFVPYLNLVLVSLDRSRFTLLICLLYCVWLFGPSVVGATWGYGRLFFFLVMYCTGGYIRYHVHNKVKYPNWINLAVGVASLLFILGSVVWYDLRGVALGNDRLIQNAEQFREYDTLPAVILAVSTFLFFSNISFHSRIIDVVGGCTLGIYLIHDNYLVRQLIWRSISPNYLYVGFPYLHALIKILVVFIASFLIECLRKRTIGAWLDMRLIEYLDRILCILKRCHCLLLGKLRPANPKS